MVEFCNSIKSYHATIQPH